MSKANFSGYLCIDVRSPSEFKKGHIPGAINLPLLNDEERARVGTCYKQIGPSAAVELGYELVGHKFAGFIKEAKTWKSPLQIYCWRGGLRSKTMHWVLESAGLTVSVREGGYKAFRTWALDTLTRPRNVHLLGGLTGSGKTEQLKKFSDHKEQVLDLEALASHRGSSFGMLGMPPQPTNEQFENEIAVRWDAFTFDKPVWIEDESRMIGTCLIPEGIYAQMRTARFFWLDAPKEERLKRLTKEYGNYPKEHLILGTLRLAKRLGSERTARVIHHLNNQETSKAFDLLLDYYDHAYTYSLQKKHLQNEGATTIKT